MDQAYFEINDEYGIQGQVKVLGVIAPALSLHHKEHKRIKVNQ